MRVLFPVLFAVTGCSTLSASNAPRLTSADDDKALLGGSTEVEYTSEVAILGTDGTLHCTGVVLDDDWVLTEGYCLEDVLIDDLRIGVGASAIADMQQFRITDMNGSSWGALSGGVLLFQVTDADLTEFATPAILASHSLSDALLAPGAYGTVTGWGRDDFDGPHHETLRSVRLPIVDEALCAQSNNWEDVYCAGFIGFEGEDICEDFGAPMTFEVNGKSVVAGLAFEGMCGDASKPSNFVNLSEHLFDIEAIVRDVQIAYDLPNADGDDHGDGRDEATPMDETFAFSATGALVPDDVDVFQFEVPARQWIEIESHSAIDTMGHLTNVNGETVASDDDGGDGYNFAMGMELTPGVYFLEVSGYNGVQSGDYTVSVLGL